MWAPSGTVGSGEVRGGAPATRETALLEPGRLVERVDAVEIGTEVVLLGRQGEETISASEWADRLGTIPYEVCCGIGDRVPRRYLG